MTSDPAGDRPSPGRRRRMRMPWSGWSRRYRIAAWTGTGAALLAVGLVVVDRGAEVVVERVVAGRVQDCLQTPDRPDVEISGFPLLPDLVRGRLEGMTLHARDANAQGVRVADLYAEARGVQRQGSGGKIDSLRGRGLVTFDAINDQALGLRVSNAGEGDLRVAGGIGLLSGSATTTPRIEDGALVLEPGEVSSALFGDVDFEGFPAIRIPLRELPAGVEVDLNPTDDGLEFDFAGTDVRLPDNPCDV